MEVSMGLPMLAALSELERFGKSALSSQLFSQACAMKLGRRGLDFRIPQLLKNTIDRNSASVVRQYNAIPLYFC